MWRFVPVLVGLTIGFSHAACGGDSDPTEQSFRATAVPDRVVLSWSGDPGTTQSVTWRTAATVRAGFAELAVAGPGPELEKSAKRIDAVPEKLSTNLGDAHYFSVTFTGLQPDTLYAYRVGHKEAMSEWFQFRTMKATAAPLEFIYVGDAQTNLKSLWSRLIRQAQKDAPYAQFVLHAGDLVNRGDADDEWGEWCYALGWASGSVAQLATPGNHEYSSRKKDGPRELTRHWQPQFEFPQNGPMGMEESVYFIDVQGVRMVFLNSNVDFEMQAAWLESVLKENPCRWTVVSHHHPIYSTSRGRDNEVLRKTWQPIYDRYGVDLVLQGHDHSYGRSRLIAGAKSSEQKATEPVSVRSEDSENLPAGVRGRTPGGAVYVVSVSGPKQYNLKQYENESNPFERRAANTQLFQVIRIDGDVLKYEARTATGSLYDGFELRKQKSGKNEMISRPLSDVPERLADPRDDD